MVDYKVIYEIGGRLFSANKVFADVHAARAFRDHFQNKGFDSAVVYARYDHHMRAGFKNYEKMLKEGHLPNSERPFMLG